MQLDRSKLFSEVRAYIMITLGLLMYTFAVTAFLAPHRMVGGGVTGMATIIYFLTDQKIPIGYSYFVINFILIGVAIKILGPKFGVKTIYAVVVSSLLLSVFQSIIREPLLEDKFMCVVLSGIMCGAGIGISLVNGGSTAGTDIVAMIINKYKNVSPGKVILYIDVVVIGCSYFISDAATVEAAGRFATIIYGYVVMGVSSYTIDLVFTGQMQSVQFFIFTDKYAEVADAITKDLNRGVTVVDCQGWYTGEHRKMLVIVTRKSEMQDIMRVTKLIDQDAFLTMNTVMGVYGRGFDTLRP